jgi:signal transduction histidine kinase
MRHHLETLGLLDGVGARVRLKVGEDEIDSLLRGGMAVSKHLELEIPEDLRRLSEEAEVAIFRIIQASLTNVHLHSGVSEAHVKIEQNLDAVIIAVGDQGHGIPEGVLDHTSRIRTVGIGITGMRERVKQLDGCLEIKTGRSGTTVKATIPNRHFRTATSAASVQMAYSLS